MSQRLTERASGVYTISATPFAEDGALDLASTDDLRVRLTLRPHLGVAQVVERLPWEQEVVGSSPVTQTIPPLQLLQ